MWVDEDGIGRQVPTLYGLVSIKREGEGAIAQASAKTISPIALNLERSGGTIGKASSGAITAGVTGGQRAVVGDSMQGKLYFAVFAVPSTRRSRKARVYAEFCVPVLFEFNNSCRSFSPEALISPDVSLCSLLSIIWSVTVAT